MEKPALNNPDRFPDESELSSRLGDAFEAWNHFHSLLKFHFPEFKPEWNFYKDGNCWLCKVLFKKKTMCWISIWDGFFKVTVYFNIKTENEVFSLEIDQDLKEKFRISKSSGKIKPFTFELRNPHDLTDIEKVLRLKLILK